MDHVGKHDYPHVVYAWCSAYPHDAVPIKMRNTSEQMKYRDQLKTMLFTAARGSTPCASFTSWCDHCDWTVCVLHVIMWSLWLDRVCPSRHHVITVTGPGWTAHPPGLFLVQMRVERRSVYPAQYHMYLNQAAFRETEPCKSQDRHLPDTHTLDHQHVHTYQTPTF